MTKFGIWCSVLKRGPILAGGIFKKFNKFFMKGVPMDRYYILCFVFMVSFFISAEQTTAEILVFTDRSVWQSYSGAIVTEDFESEPASYQVLNLPYTTSGGIVMAWLGSGGSIQMLPNNLFSSISPHFRAFGNRLSYSFPDGRSVVMLGFDQFYHDPETWRLQVNGLEIVLTPYEQNNYEPSFIGVVSVDEPIYSFVLTCSDHAQGGLSIDNISYSFDFAPAPVLEGLEIVGPSELAEDSQQQYRAIAVYDNNSTEDVTALADWSVEPNDNCSIAAGLLTTEAIAFSEDVVVSARYTQGEITQEAEKQVSIFAVCSGGYALEFDGTGDYVEIVNNNATLDISGDQITVGAWVKAEIIDKRQVIVAKNAYHANSWILEINPVDFGNGKINFYIDLPGSDDNFGSNISIGINQWSYIVGVYDGNQRKIYINGQLDASQTIYGSIPSSAEPVRIGGGGNMRRYIDSLIDEVAIYDRALSAEEILAAMHRKADGGEPNLVGYWGFDEGEGGFVTDRSGNGNDGMIIGAQWTEDIPPVGICNFVAVDIKPGSCPNPVNLKSKGVLTVAVLGSENFDVTSIDAASVRLEGIGAIRSSYEDVSGMVVEANDCECTEEGPDGYADLIVKFRTQEIVDELVRSQGELEKNQTLMLSLTGELSDGGAVTGTDCVELVGNVSKWLAAKRLDYNEDGVVNGSDFVIMAEYWLESIDD